MATEKVQYSIELVDEITAKLKKIKSHLNENDQDFQKTGKSVDKFSSSITKGALKLGGMVTAVISLKKVIDFTNKAILDFSGSSARLKAIVQPTTQEFYKLEQAALKLGSTTAFTSSQIMDSFTNQAKLGQKVNDILASGNSVLSLAALAQIDLSEAAEMSVQTMNQFGLQASEMNRIVDVMAKSFTSSALDARKFSEAMKYAGTIGAETGVSLETVSAILSVLADRGIEASMAGTSTRRVLQELADESSKVNNLLKKFGSTSKTVEDKLKDLNKIGLSVTDTTELFGMEASTTATILVKSVDNVDKLSEAYKNAKGTGEQMAEVMLDSIPGSVVKMKSALEGLVLTFNDKFAPAYKKIIDYVTDLAGAWKFLLDQKNIKEQEQYLNSVIQEGVELKKLRKEYENIRDTQLALKAMKGTLFNPEALQDAKNNIETINLSLKELNNTFKAVDQDTNSPASQKSSSSSTAGVSSKASGSSIVQKLIEQEKAKEESLKKIQQYTLQFQQSEAQTAIAHEDFIQSIKDEARKRDEEESRRMYDLKVKWMEDLTEKNRQHAQKRLEDEQRMRESWKSTMIDSAASVSNMIFSISQTRKQREQKLQIEQIKNSKKSEAEKQKAIEAIERQAFEKNKRASMLQALINGALGATKTIATMGMPAAIPMLIAQGFLVATQIATIAAQKFDKGGIVQKEAGKSSYGDQHIIRANPGEMVLTQEQQRSLGQSINIGETNITINGEVNQASIYQLNKTLQDRNEDLRKSLLSLQEAGRISGLRF